MLLAFDIGNTNIVVGVFDGEKLLCVLRLHSQRNRTVDEYRVLLKNLLEIKLETGSRISHAAICSVVPPITPEIIRYIQEDHGIEPHIIDARSDLGMSIALAAPLSVGADRLVNAVAAKALVGSPALVVDFGTATSFDLVGKDGSFQGGIIAPGPLTALDALVHNTAKLPRIELRWPDSVVGKDTVSAMEAGTVVGYLCLVDGLIERMRAEVGELPHIVATGGLGELFGRHSRFITRYEPDLTLQGIRVVATRNGVCR
jgi:type III pantothenate kinase